MEKDQLGYLILNIDGAVVSSGGELENSEHTANTITHLISIAKTIIPHEDGYKKLTVSYPSFMYVVCVSNKQIHVSKRNISSESNKIVELLSE